MRWIIKPKKLKQTPNVGDVREIERFALFPTTVECSSGIAKVWLEKYICIQKYHSTTDFYLSTYNRWETIRKTIKT